MNVIYNSDHFWILAYPSLQGFELFDKETLSIAYLGGAYATNFVRSMRDIPEAARDETRIDALLDDFCQRVGHPIVFH